MGLGPGSSGGGGSAIAAFGADIDWSVVGSGGGSDDAVVDPDPVDPDDTDIPDVVFVDPNGIVGIPGDVVTPVAMRGDTLP